MAATLAPAGSASASRRSTGRVSVASDGTQADGQSLFPSVNADGRFVAFQSAVSDLVADDSNGRADVFVHDRQTGATERVSVASDGTQAHGDSLSPSISADGRHVAFESVASDLVADDTNGRADVFVHDRQTGATERVSVASDGTQAHGGSRRPSISPDGRHVAFHSIASNLVADDTNSAPDVFVHWVAAPPEVKADQAQVVVDEGSTASATGTLSDPDGDVVTLDASVGSVTDNGDGTSTWSYTPGDGPEDSQTVTVTAADAEGLTGSASFDLVVDDVAPTIALAGDASVDEGDTYTLDLGTITDPGDDTVSSWVVDWGDGTADTFVSGGDKTHVYADGPAGNSIAVDLIDEDGTHEGAGTKTITVSNVAPTVGDITGPVDPVAVGTEVDVEASFSDPGVGDTHTAVWEWGDGTTSPGVVDQADGVVSGSHTYAAAGVYTVTLTVTDDDGAAGKSVFEFVVVYDPDGGFVTGGGWIDSPEGAYTPDPDLSGKAHFGFVSKYKKGASTPTGNTTFRFKAAALDFKSSTYEWLVIAGAKAKFKGSGTINGAGDYGFLLTAIDGEADGGGGQDRFRIKIWDKTTDQVVYDNKDGDNDTTALEQGSIVIHNSD